MNFVPLCHNSPRPIVTLILGNQTLVNEPDDIIKDGITLSRAASLQSNVSDRPFPANVVVGPEWRENVSYSRGEVGGWITIGMGKLPGVIEREGPIFVNLQERQVKLGIQCTPYST